MWKTIVTKCKVIVHDTFCRIASYYTRARYSKMKNEMDTATYVSYPQENLLWPNDF